MPVTQFPQRARSPTLSPSRVASPASNSTPKVNGTRINSPVPDARPVRQDKKRMSLSFFGIGAPNSEGTSSQNSVKQEKSPADDAASPSASSRSRSHDRSKSKNHPSRSLVPTSPVPEALPHFPAPSAPSSSHHSLSKVHSRASSRGQSVDGRPGTSKSMKSDKSESHSRSSSMKKRLSYFSLGKKGSKGNVRGRVDDTLEEE